MCRPERTVGSPPGNPCHSLLSLETQHVPLSPPASCQRRAGISRGCRARLGRGKYCVHGHADQKASNYVRGHFSKGAGTPNRGNCKGHPWGCANPQRGRKAERPEESQDTPRSSSSPAGSRLTHSPWKLWTSCSAANVLTGR